MGRGYGSGVVIGQAGLAIALTLGVLLAPVAPAGADVRAVRGAVGGFAYQVLLPSGYDTTAHRYPVLYLVAGNGGRETTAASRLGLAAYVERDQVIVVTPAEPQHNNLITDWADGSNPLDRNFAAKLIPAIDGQFRTLADRAHRAIAGVSTGGYSSLAIAARHPDLFVAAASFSGLVDIADRGAAGEATVEIPQDLLVDSAPGELFHRFGNPYTNPLLWAERNPTDLAGNLRGMSLYASAGNGVPSDAQEINDAGPSLAQEVVVENQVASMTAQFINTLSGDAIPVVYRTHPGIHQERHWRDDLAIWWPQMIKALGSAPPAEFDYRAAATDFSVWGWSLHADRQRAPEFLSIAKASPAGLTLTGSGIEQVSTAPDFAPGTSVSLTGAVQAAAVADSDGRISFDVNLGPAHQAEQYTPQAGQETFVTRRVTFDVNRGDAPQAAQHNSLAAPETSLTRSVGSRPRSDTATPRRSQPNRRHGRRAHSPRGRRHQRKSHRRHYNRHGRKRPVR